MKSCDNCRFLNGNECDIFGDYVPNFLDTGEGCKLKYNEACKLLKLADTLKTYCYCLETNAKEFRLFNMRYNHYVKQLKKKYGVVEE